MVQKDENETKLSACEVEGIRAGNLLLFPIENLAAALGCHEQTLREYLNSGKLKGRKFAKRWFVTEGQLREYFESQEEKPDVD